MTKDNHNLGNFELTGIPPAPRESHKSKLPLKLTPTVFCKWPPKIREPEKPKRSPLPQKRDVSPKRKLSAWSTRRKNSPRKIARLRNVSMLAMDLNLTCTTSRILLKMTRRVWLTSCPLRIRKSFRI